MIETERLILREWRAADRIPFARLCRSPAVQRHLGGVRTDPQIDEDIARIADRFRRFSMGRWSVERRNDGYFLGLCGLAPFDRPGTPIHGDIEIGWQLAEEAWGRGYATEAARASLAWGWANLDVARIVAITVPANLPSRKVMERIGMVRRPDLDFHHPLFAEGHPLRAHLTCVAERPREPGPEKN